MMNRLVLRLESTKFHWICPKVWCFCRSPKPAEAYEPFTSFSMFQWSKLRKFFSLRVCAGTTGHWSEMHCGAWRGHVSWSGWPEVVWSWRSKLTWWVWYHKYMGEVSKFKFLFPVVRDLFVEICLWRSTEMVWISLGIDLFTVGASDILERIHRFPLGLECRCRFVSSEIWCFPFFCLKYTTLKAQLCQIQDSEQMRLMRWSRIFLEANISRSLGAQGNDSFSHPDRGEIKSFNPNKGYGFVGCEVPDKKTSILMQFPLWEVIGFWS